LKLDKVDNIFVFKTYYNFYPCDYVKRNFAIL
jgi:hypothetical protein